MNTIELKYIASIDDYLDELSLGNQPLSNWKKYAIDFLLRMDIQQQLFGKTQLSKGNIPTANQKYYAWKWDNSLNVCEECAKPLHNYSSYYISHILTRGSHPEMAHDPRNSRILCDKCHDLTENEDTHRELKIYEVDLIIIEILKYEYQQVKEKRTIEVR